MTFPRRSPWRGWIAPILFIPSAAAAQADPDPICADRPGKATGTCTVAAGRVQLETGLADWSLTKDARSRQSDTIVGETAVKFGLSDRSNVAVVVTPLVRSVVREGGVRTRASGFGDVTLLYKHRVTADDAAIEVALVPSIKIPTAKHAIGNGKIESGLLVPISYQIPRSNFSIGATPEIDWLADADGRGHHGVMAHVVSLGWQAAPGLSLATEIWGQWDWDPKGTVKQASIDGSMAYLLSDDVQLDAGANFGLNRATPDVELYAGVSVRF